MRPATVVPVLSVLVSLGLAIALWRASDALDQQTQAARSAEIARLKAENDTTSVTAKLLNESKARLTAEDAIRAIKDKLARAGEARDKATAGRLAAEEEVRTTSEKLARATQAHDEAAAGRLAAEDKARIVSDKLARTEQAHQNAVARRLAVEEEFRVASAKLAGETKAREEAEAKLRQISSTPAQETGASETAKKQSGTAGKNAPAAADHDTPQPAIKNRTDESSIILPGRSAAFPAALHIGAATMAENSTGAASAR